MHGFKLIEQDIQSIDKAEAERLRDFCDSDYQRPVNWKHVRKLANMQKNDTFRTGQIVLAHVAGKVLVADGQHTLHAIIDSGVATSCLVERYDCEDMPAYGRLYHSFNTEDRKRSMTDSAQAAMMTGAVGSGGLAPSLLTKFTTGLQMYYRHIGKDFPTVRFDRFLETDKFGAAKATFASLLKDTGVTFSNTLTRSGCCAAFIAMHENADDKTEVSSFWRQVVTGLWEDDQPGDVKVTKHAPIYRLHVWLREVALRGGRGAGKVKEDRRMTSTEIFYTCLNIWNLWCDRTEELKAFHVIRTPKERISKGMKAVPRG